MIYSNSSAQNVTVVRQHSTHTEKPERNLILPYPNGKLCAILL